MGKRRSPDHWIREGDVIGTRNESRIYLLLYVFYSTVNGTILNRSMVNVTFFIYTLSDERRWTGSSKAAFTGYSVLRIFRFSINLRVKT